MESAQNEMLRFPGGTGSREAYDPSDVREDLLLKAIGEGKQYALSALYRRRGGQIYSLLLRILVSEMEAQEVLQDTFIRIWRRAHHFDSTRSSPRTWMISIARGLAFDRLRSKSRRSVNRAAYEHEIGSLAVEEMDGAHQAAQAELASACATALHRLPEPQNRALQLAFLRGWTHEEIALAEGEPLGTIKARIRRGLLAMRRALKDYHG